MNTCFATIAGSGFSPNPDDDIMDSLFHQYERVIVESLITTFGLDFLIKDQHGGDVDTINNVRKLDDGPDHDPKMTYKNKANESAYENRGAYNKSKYDSDPRFKAINKEVHQQKKSGTLKDSYTGKTVPRNADIDLDHVISTKEIHEDRGRTLSGLSGLDLANCEENLKPTDRSINRSMKEKTIDDYCKWLDKTEPQRAAELTRLRNKSELTDAEKKLLHKYEQQALIDQDQMKFHDKTARKAYEAKLAAAYYTSSKFAADTAKAAGKVGIQMGIRQALGLVFTEIWFSVKAEFNNVSAPFQMGDFLSAIGNGIKRGFNNAKEKYKELLNKFKEGAISGILSNLTTTLCNIFFTTAKNVVKIIRQSYASLVQAAKILFLNPDNLPFGERMRATSKIIATGASVVVGTIVSEAIADTGIKTIPIICDIVPAFCGTLITGILTCTLLYYLDRSEDMNRLVSVLNTLPTISTEVDFYKHQAVYFENYAAELMKIDLAKFKEEITMYSTVAKDLETVEDEITLNLILKKALKTLGIEVPWGDSFDDFMNDKSKVLIFE